MTDEEIIAEFHAAEALLTGHFILTSGLRSDTYLQRARVMMDARRGERPLTMHRTGGAVCPWNQNRG